MFTKSFSDKGKWLKVRGLVGLIDFTKVKHLFTTSSVHHPSESVKKRVITKSSVACVAIPISKQCSLETIPAILDCPDYFPAFAMSGSAQPKSYADAAKGAAAKGKTAAGKGEGKGDKTQTGFNIGAFGDGRWPELAQSVPPIAAASQGVQ